MWPNYLKPKALFTASVEIYEAFPPTLRLITSLPFLKYKNTTSRSLDDDSVLGTYKYIYGQYLQPFNQKDGWEISRLSIEVPDIAFNKNTVDMRLTFDRNFEDGNIIKIKNIKVQLSKDSLTIGKLVGKIKSLFK